MGKKGPPFTTGGKAYWYKLPERLFAIFSEILKSLCTLTQQSYCKVSCGKSQNSMPRTCHIEQKNIKKGLLIKDWLNKFWYNHKKSTVVLKKTLESPLDRRRSNQSILKEINPEYSLQGLMLKLQYFGGLMRRADSLEKTLMLGKTEGKRRGQQRMM